MACDILDVRCIVVNELIGSPVLAMIFLAIIYFIIASKLRFGFETTVAFAIPVLLAMSVVVYGFAIIYAFMTLLAGGLLAMVVLRMIGNK